MLTVMMMTTMTMMMMTTTTMTVMMTTTTMTIMMMMMMMMIRTTVMMMIEAARVGAVVGARAFYQFVLCSISGFVVTRAMRLLVLYSTRSRGFFYGNPCFPFSSQTITLI